MYPLGQAKQILRRCRDLTSTAPDELCVYAALRTLPDGTQVATFPMCYAGPIADGERVLAPLRAAGPPIHRPSS